MKLLKGVDLKRAYLVPSSVFGSPDEVVRSERLSLAQKRAVLRRWEFDARRVAGFGDDRDRAIPSMLRDVRLALRRLDADEPRALGQGAPPPAPKRLAKDPLVPDLRHEPSWRRATGRTLGE